MAVCVFGHIKLDLRIPLMRVRQGASRCGDGLSARQRPDSVKRRGVQRSTSAADEDELRRLVINDVTSSHVHNDVTDDDVPSTTHDYVHAAHLRCLLKATHCG